MTPIRTASRVRSVPQRLALSLCLALTTALAAPLFASPTAKQTLLDIDKTTYSGQLELHVDRYDPPGKDGKPAVPERYRAQVLFERPDRFRLVLRPGEWNEFRAVGEAGIVRWLHPATGISGKQAAEDVTDPLALWLLGTAGDLLRFTGATDLPPGGMKGGLRGVRLDPETYGTTVVQATAWFDKETPVGMEFRLQDGSSVFVSILRFDRNVQTSPGDFQL
ncbi:hypothetical protein [Lysobacter hankyongensis]|uniref:Outer membrane lipoprotein carrier protein LolA n=1 Tax=Lysobacter hankyongensis TaxID=1176535 RepID=A0ABP9BK64_9GAMM